MNSYAKFGGAARRHFSAICEKPMGGAHMCPPPGRARVNPRRHRPFRILPRHKGGGWYDPPPLAVSPLIELQLRRKNERVARRETKRLIYNLTLARFPYFATFAGGGGGGVGTTPLAIGP